MKTTLIAAVSLDGYITRHDQPGSGFTSPEDKQFFQQAVLGFDCLIFGARNYQQSRDWIHQHLRQDQLKVVLSRDPSKYRSEQRPNQLEFTDQQPRALVTELEKRGHRNACLLGGGQIYGLFLAEKAVDELWLTLEPVLFGDGIKLAEAKIDLRAELLSHEQLNRSTLLLKYRPT